MMNFRGNSWKKNLQPVNFKHIVMKKLSQFVFLISLMLLITACGVKYTITTKIFPDGSCLRVMTARLDSSNYHGNPFFIPIDSTWEQTVRMEQDTVKDDTYAVVTVQKKYSSVEEMNREFYNRDEISDTPKLTMRLTKKFQWFYTKFKYEETYIQQFPFRNFPLSNYYTQEEIEAYIYEDPVADSLFFLGKDSLEQKRIHEELDKKGEEFVADNIFEEFFLNLQKSSKKVSISFFRDQDLDELKSDMKKELRPYLVKHIEGDADTTALQILSRLDNYYGTKAFSELYSTDTTTFTMFNKKLEVDVSANYIDDYEHTITLPGILLNTNATQLVDGRPDWQFEASMFVFCDYTMWAESKKTNKWAFVVTIVLIILSFGMLLFRKRKK